MFEPEDKEKPADTPANETQQIDIKKNSGRRRLEEIALKKRDIKKERLERKRRRIKDELCAYCKRRNAVTVEHFIPRSSRLEIAFRKINLIPACESCNAFKGGRWPNQREVEWFFEYWKKQLQDIENHLKIAEAIKRNKHGKVEEETLNAKRKLGPKSKRRHLRR